MICFIYRWVLSLHVTNRSEPKALTRRHLSKCAACSSYYQAHCRIAERLREEAVSEPLPRFLYKKPENRENVIAQKSFGIRKPAFIATAATTAAAACILVFVWASSPSQQQIDSLDDNASKVLAAAEVQNNAFQKAGKYEGLSEEGDGIKAFTREAFMLVCDSFLDTVDTFENDNQN